MNIRWQIKFASLRGTVYVIDIYDADYNDSSITQLIGTAEPFTTNEDTDDDVFVPVRMQSGYIKFVAQNDTIVGDLMPVQATDRPVVLRTSDGTVCWIGFLSQELYSQPWEPCPYEIEIPVVSVMMAMQGVRFTQDEGYTSLLSLMNTISGYLPEDISAVISEASPIADVFVQNKNFHDAESVSGSILSASNDCDTIYACVEQFCLYFGVSLREYEGVFYFSIPETENVRYEDMDLDGNTRQTRWGGTQLSQMTICGANNMRDYSTPYRRIKGDFETGRDKADAIYEQPSFLGRFQMKGAYPTTAPANLLFYGDDEIKPYKNDIQQTSWISDVYGDWGGQIIRHRDKRLNDVETSGSSWSDYFFVFSLKSKAGTPSRAVTFDIPGKAYINNGEYAAFNISCDVKAWWVATQGGDFIKRLYCKIKVGNYWLKTIDQEGYEPRYEWTTEESVCFLLIDNGQVTMNGAQYTLDYRMEAMMSTVSGLAIDMPSGLGAGYYSIYFELLCNAENTDAFGDYSSIGYLVSGLRINVLRATNSVTNPTPNLDSNEFMVTAADTRGDDYTVGCYITTRQGTQYGPGCALDSTHAYITTRYDQDGINRRAEFLRRSRNVLTIDVREHTQPIDYIEYNDKNYIILSQGINWRDDVNTIKIIEV